MKKKQTTKKSAARGQDIINLILEDHKPLKKLIKIMKDSDKSLSKRKAAFEKFGPLLMIHANPEEEVLYARMKQDEDMREDSFEGEVEHGLADQMLEESKRTTDEDQWSARVKVLAELVEHHIKEEESDLLPLYRKNSEREERIELGQAYLEAKSETKPDGQKKRPLKQAEDLHAY